MPTKHSFTSPVADGPDSALVRPSNWNDSHAVTGLMQSNTVLTANETLNAFSYAYVPDHLEIAAGVVIEIGGGAILEIG